LPSQRFNSKIEVPARLFLTREEVDLAPREYAERAYANLSYGRAERCGYFLASEEPELFPRFPLMKRNGCHAPVTMRTPKMGILG